MTEYLLVFDVWAPFAYFRRVGTTTTSSTYSIMTRSAAEGLVGAILGYAFEESPKKLAASRIAIGIQSPVRKIPFSATYTDTKEVWPKLRKLISPSRKRIQKSRRTLEFRTPIKMNLLREPCYRIYFDDSEEKKQDLERKLLNHEVVFTPYLGSSSMIANFKYIGRYQYKTVDVAGATPVVSIVPFFKTMPKIHLEKDVTFAVEQNLPIHLTPDRILTGTYNAAYSPSGFELKILSSETPVQEILMQESKSHVFFIPTKVPSKAVS